MDNGKVLIGLCGLAGSGKDTVANNMVSFARVVKISLADPLKRICQEVFDFTAAQLWGPSENRNAPDRRYRRGADENGIVYLTPRFALQQLGVEWGRNCYEDVWIDYAIRHSNHMRGFDVVIPDVRFRNEIDAIHRAGGFIVRINRPGAGLEGAAATHASEAEQMTLPGHLFDYIIENDGSLETLSAKTLEVVGSIRGRQGKSSRVYSASDT